MGLKSIAILPARLGSTRLAQKVLLHETGLPLFVHTAQNAARLADLEAVLVATDSQLVLDQAATHGIQACLTRADHQSGTDRVREALDLWEKSTARTVDVVLNVQADEPDLEPADLARLLAAFEDPTCQAATLAIPIQTMADWQRPSAVKVVTDASGNALYFSRSPIPSRVHSRVPAPNDWGLRHIGVYAFRPDSLRRFCDLAPGRLEQLENLEQLRWLEAGAAMRVVPATRAPRGIDTPEDYAEFVARHKKQSPPH